MELTVGQFIEDLKNYDPDMVLDFSGLDFYRLKDRGGCIQVEFGQTVYKNDDGKVIVENHR